MVRVDYTGIGAMEFVRDQGHFRSLVGEFIWELFNEEISEAVKEEYRVRGISPKTNIYALDAHGFSDSLEKRILSDDSVKVFFVINLTKSSAPYLKCADLIVFLNPDQCRLYDILYQYTKPSTILRLKEKPSELSTDPQGLAILLAWHYKPYEYLRLAKTIAKVVGYYYERVDISSIRIICQSPLLKNKKLADHVRSMTKKDVDILDTRNLTEAKAVMTECLYAEVIDSGDFQDPFTIMRNPDMRFEIRSVDYDVSAFMLPVIAASYGCKSLSNAGCKQYIPKPYYASNEIGLNRTEELQPQTDSVNIVYGEPLSNRFVLSILFRNVGDKLERCIRSVLNLRLQHDVGIALVDDCSEDDAVEAAVVMIIEAGIPACVVVNESRRYAAHNYHLVINRMVTSDDSIIVDLDGDDMLNEDIDVFSELEMAYSDGLTQKTFGSFKTVADDASTNVGGASKEIFIKIFQGYQLLNDASAPYNQFRCQSWMHLRSARRGLLRRVEAAHFKNRSTGKWLTTDHDASVNSRAMELAGWRNVKYLDKPLYMYDITGSDHDFMQKRGSDVYDILLDLHRVYTFDNVDRSATD